MGSWIARVVTDGLGSGNATRCPQRQTKRSHQHSQLFWQLGRRFESLARYGTADNSRSARVTSQCRRSGPALGRNSAMRRRDGRSRRTAPGPPPASSAVRSPARVPSAAGPDPPSTRRTPSAIGNTSGPSSPASWPPAGLSVPWQAPPPLHVACSRSVPPCAACSCRRSSCPFMASPPPKTNSTAGPVLGRQVRVHRGFLQPPTDPRHTRLPKPRTV